MQFYNLYSHQYGDVFLTRWVGAKVLLLTLSGTCIGYGLWIFAGSFWILVLSRTIGGIAVGIYPWPPLRLQRRHFSANERSKGMAIVGIAFGLGLLWVLLSVDLPVLGIGQMDPEFSI